MSTDKQNRNDFCAVRWYKNGDHPNDQTNLINGENGPFRSEGSVVRYFRHPDVDGDQSCKHCNHVMHDHGFLDSGEEGVTVCPGNWIVNCQEAEYQVLTSDEFEKFIRRY